MIESLIEAVKGDLAIAARMGGCYPVAYGASVQDYLPPDAVERLDRAIRDDRQSESICDALFGLPTILTRFCPLEVGHLDLAEGKNLVDPGPAITDSFVKGLHPLQGSCGSAIREFELFLFYANRIDKTTTLFRLLPLPVTMKLRITTVPPDLDWCFKPEECLLPLLPGEVRLEVAGLNYERNIRYDDLDEASQFKLRASRRFLNRVLIDMNDGASPAEAWARAAERENFDDFCPYSEIPDPLVRKFRDAPLNDPIAAAEEIRKACATGLDAAAFVTSASADILARLEDNRGERLKADYFDSFEDRFRYCRLSLPLRELLKQDRYVGWLPMKRAYRDERSAVLDEINGNHSDDDSTAETQPE